MSPETAIALALGLPLGGAVLTGLLAHRPNVRETFTLLVGVGLFCSVVSLVPDVAGGQRPSLSLFEILPGLALAFEVEPLGLLFALVASGLWVVTSGYSIGYLRGLGEEHQTRYYACFAVAILGAIGAAMAQNLLTLFLFYEVLTLSTYPLVTHHGTEKAMRGGRTYLGLLLFTSVGLLLLAILWTWQAAG
ncbi:MAG: proton-conducting transporter membrane subunit, partial [Planctomycetota bacterium]